MLVSIPNGTIVSLCMNRCVWSMEFGSVCVHVRVCLCVYLRRTANGMCSGDFGENRNLFVYLLPYENLSYGVYMHSVYTICRSLFAVC